MAFKDPKAITEVATEKGIEKAHLPAGKAIVAGFLAGAYIAFASLLAVVVSSGLNVEIWGGVITLITGGVFTLGLVLVIIAGSELLTGNMALLPLGAFRKKVSGSQIVKNFGFVALGNLLGSLFVAYFIAVKSGVVTAEAPLERLGTLAQLKADGEGSGEIFLRGLGCNWLVCLAVWMAFAADDVGGKILAIFFPIMAFVAMGFDHIVANMFFLPAAIFAGVDGVNWLDTLHNWTFAFLGNLAGGAIFVGGAYWYLYGRDEEDAAPGDTERGGNGVGITADGREARTSAPR